MVKAKILDECPYIPEDKSVKFTSAGNVRNIQYMSKRNHKQTILKISNDEVMNLATGEIISVQHAENKTQCKSLKKTLADLRMLINANVSDPKCLRWVTLTYKENMTDTKQLYRDCHYYHDKINRYCKAHGYEKPEYIDVMEPQERGAWHVHELLIWENEAPYIPNKTLAEKWGKGFVQIKKVNEKCDNIGAYLSPYLSDLEIDPTTPNFDALKGERIKEVEMVEDGEKKTKKFIKGARLTLYPPGMQIYRHSRGIKKPTEEMTSYGEAIKKVSELGASKTYEKTIELSDGDGGFNCTIYNAYYNIQRKK